MAQEFEVDDLSDVIDELATGIYAVSRPGPTTYTNGRRDPPTTTAFELRALVHNVSGRALDRLPEGLRTKEAIAIFSTVELKTSSSAGEPDVVTYAGNTYQVDVCDRWKASGNYFRSLATKVSST